MTDKALSCQSKKGCLCIAILSYDFFYSQDSRGSRCTFVQGYTTSLICSEICSHILLRMNRDQEESSLDKGIAIGTINGFSWSTIAERSFTPTRKLLACFEYQTPVFPKFRMIKVPKNRWKEVIVSIIRYDSWGKYETTVLFTLIRNVATPPDFL